MFSMPEPYIIQRDDSIRSLITFHSRRILTMGSFRSSLVLRLSVMLVSCIALVSSTTTVTPGRRPPRVLNGFVMRNGLVVNPGSGSSLPGGLPSVPVVPPREGETAEERRNRARNATRRTTDDVEPDVIVAQIAADALFDKTSEGLKQNVTQDEIDQLAKRISNNETEKAIATGQQKAQSIARSAAKTAATTRGNEGKRRKVEAFGPHLFTSKSAATIGRTSDKFLAASEQLRRDLRLSRRDARVLRSVPLTTIKQAFDCPFDDAIVCDPSSKYRTFDGTCNNLANPILGRSNTPFERFMPANYEDGIGAMRETGAGSGRPLPNPRLISTTVHQVSHPRNRQFGVSLFTMIFGQFISHDVNMNTISRGTDGVFLQCCESDGSVTQDPQMIELGCRPIAVPSGDPFYSQFGRRCLSFIRALGGTDLKCNLGSREQTNQVSHYIDGSGIYGNSVERANILRKFTGGLLLSNTAPNGEELLLQNPKLTGGFACRSPAGSNEHCFTAGDVRVNQNPSLMFVHTLFLRAHNRIAKELEKLNPNWNDERLFQEARKIVIALLQHITYNEYLPILISRPLAQAFRLLPEKTGYHLGYSETINPAIRNEFVAAAYRSGHSNIDDFLGPSLPLGPSFNNPSAIYTRGVTGITHGLTGGAQQTMDRLDADTITNRLFEGPKGTGTDLPAINIQRGRDHGLPSYNDFREFCGFPRVRRFSIRRGGFIHHSLSAVARLVLVYRSPDDVDPWTGMTSESRLKGGVFGPTAACITGLQFLFLKRGDRHYYENNDLETKFAPDQLDAIRRITLSSLLCTDTDRKVVATNSFLTPSLSNPELACNNIPTLDLTPWRERTCVDGGWSDWLPWTPCSVFGVHFQFRFCDNPFKNECGKDCEGSAWNFKRCTFRSIFSEGRGGKASSKPKPTPPPLHGNNPEDMEKILNLAKTLAPKGVFPSGAQ